MNVYKKNILIIVLLIVFLFVNIFYVYLFRNNIDQPQLPVKYKSYKEFRKTTVKSLNYEIIKLRGSWDDKDYFGEPIFVENSDFVVLHSNAWPSANGDSFYYKLDKNGKLVDSIPDINYSGIRDGYLIAENEYSSWMIDGDTLKHKYTDLNSDAGWQPERIKTEFDKLRNKAVSTAYFNYDRLWKYDSENYENKIDKAVFLVEGKWYALYGEDLDLPDYTTLSKEKEKSYQTKYIHLLQADHFHKTALKGRDMWVWKVNAYFNFIKEKDTLKFFQEMDLNGEHGDLFLTYYSSEKINFSLILAEYGEGYYIIKAINRQQ